MANPPIVIGPFDNVPAPGSPIRSDWAQDVSTWVDGQVTRNANQDALNQNQAYLNANVPGLLINGYPVPPEDQVTIVGSTWVTLGPSGNVTVSIGFTFGNIPVVLASCGSWNAGMILMVDQPNVSNSTFPLAAVFHDGNAAANSGVQVSFIAVGTRP